jgi:hypothetical protein
VGPCGKLLSPLIRGSIDFLTTLKEPDYGINDETKVLLVQVSGAQIDRLPAPARRALEVRGISTTRGTGASFRFQARRYKPTLTERR